MHSSLGCVQPPPPPPPVQRPVPAAPRLQATPVPLSHPCHHPTPPRPPQSSKLEQSRDVMYQLLQQSRQAGATAQQEHSKVVQELRAELAAARDLLAKVGSAAVWCACRVCTMWQQRRGTWLGGRSPVHNTAAPCTALFVA
jgi:hypothetical protein